MDAPGVTVYEVTVTLAYCVSARTLADAVDVIEDGLAEPTTTDIQAEILED